MAFEGFLNPIFAPLLMLPSWAALALIATVMSLIITLVYKWLTNQEEMKALKDDMKSLQKKMKEAKNDTNKMLKMQKEVMDKNMKYMVQSMKPTLITFIPVILIFGWLNGAMAFYPILPDTSFTTTAFFNNGIAGNVTLQAPAVFTLQSAATQPIQNGQANWVLKGPAGEYFLNYQYGTETQQKQVIITTDKLYAPVQQMYTKSSFKSVKINNQVIHPLGSLSIFGWMPGWLGVYIIFSLASSMILRKVLKVY